MKRLIFLTALLSCTPARTEDEGITTIATGDTVVQPSTKRLGMNLGGTSFYDSGQMMRNLIFRNPGFEGEIYQSIVRCSSGSTVSCQDENAYSGWSAGFWNGATYEFIYGQAAGRTGKVQASTAAAQNQGVILTFSDSGIAATAGDYLILRLQVPGNGIAGWWTTLQGGTILTESNDLSPDTVGSQAVSISALGAGQLAKLTSYFDGTDGTDFTILNGRYVLNFRAKGAGGSNAVALTVNRDQNYFLNQTISLNGQWANYSIPFNAAESALQGLSVTVSFATSGASAFLLDDVSLVPDSGDPTNTTAFRDPVVQALRTLNPGVLRYWGDQLGESLDNLLAPVGARLRAGYSAFSTEKDDIGYGLHEFLQLCQSIGAEPWFVVPTVFSPSEAANLVEYLGGSSSTGYGQKRAALGQSAPWTSVFPKIHLEFGNEAWNSVFKGGSIEYPQPYGNRAQTIFAAMKASSSYNPSVFDLVLGGQAVNPGRNQSIQNSCNNNDSFTVAPYQMNEVNHFSTKEELFGPLLAEPEEIASANGYMAQNLQAIQTSSHPVPLEIYEVNLSTTGGSIPQDVLAQFATSMGAGLAVIDNMLQELRLGITTQMLWQLPQYEYRRSDNKLVRLFGAVVDMGVTNRVRPQYLAIQMVNHALGGAMFNTVQTGANPTWNQPQRNGVKFEGAHYIQSFAFQNGSTNFLVLLNLHRSHALEVNFTGARQPHGAVKMERLHSHEISDTNETSANVSITSRTLASFDATSPFQLPAYSVTVLSWTSTN